MEKQGTKAEWMRLFDPSSCLTQAKTPMLFVNGETDKFYPLETFYATYYLPDVPKKLSIIPGMKHSHEDGWAPGEIQAFIDARLNNSTDLPSLHPMQFGDNKITVTFQSDTEIQQTSLWYTTNSFDVLSEERIWKSLAGQVTKDSLILPIPPPQATIYSVNATDARELTITSDIQFEN